MSEDKATRSVRVDKKTDDILEKISKAFGESKKNIIANGCAAFEYVFNNEVGFPETKTCIMELRSLEANRRSLDNDPSASAEMKEQFDRRIEEVRNRLKSYRDEDKNGS